MKASRTGLTRALEQPDPAIRFYLFHGADESQSRALGDRLVGALKAARFVVPAGAVRSDPASLADEAGALSLFGGARVIWIEPAGDDIATGVEALLAAPAAESPVVAIAGALRKTSALLKLSETASAALAHASYVPDGQQAERMVVELGRTVGLKVAPGVGARIAEACANDQAVAAQELAKLALYCDASTAAPKALDHDAIDAVGAALPENNAIRLGDLALSGELGEMADELAHLSSGGSEAIPVVRALQRRLLMLAPARARIERGESPAAVMASFGKSLFWKEKPMVEKWLSTWSAAGLATLGERIARLERQLLFSDAPPADLLGEELVAIARTARRR